eukprot:1140933-Pelagomonas_calceolata.AAC.4
MPLQPRPPKCPPGDHPQGLHVCVWWRVHIAQPGAFSSLQGVLVGMLAGDACMAHQGALSGVLPSNHVRTGWKA